jgi:hypothetical protein
MKTIITFILISAFVVCACQKKAFKHVVIKGKLIYDSTMAPFTDTVYVMSDDALSAKNSREATTFIGEVKCKSDGSFYMRSRAAKHSRYYLYVRSKNRSYNPYPNGQRSFSALESETTDLGIIILKN